MKEKIPPKSIIFSPVRKVETREILPDFDVNSNNEYAVIIDIPQVDGSIKPKILNFCSSDYQLIENQFITDTFESVVGNQFPYTRKFHHVNHSQFYIDYLLKEEVKKILKVDDIIPRLRIINSYNGRLRLQVRFGFYRLVCKNGMTFPVMDGVNFRKSMMHTPSFYRSYREWEGVLESFQAFLAQSSNITGLYKDLAKQKFEKARLQEKVEFVIKESNFPKRQAENVVKRALEESSLYSIPMSDWVLYNAFNYQLNHNKGINMELNSKDELDSHILNIILHS